jgi:hypothetical protein
MVRFGRLLGSQRTHGPKRTVQSYAGAIEAWEVGAAVGNVKNNQSELMERVGLL